MVRVRFIGSGDAFSGGGRFQACLLLEGAGEPLMLDCGATSLVALKRAGVDPASIGFVALSHLHGDHFAGLPWLILDGQFSKRTKSLVIAGPIGTGERVERTFDALYPGAADAERAFPTTFLDLPERTRWELGPAHVTAFEVVHGSGASSYALRFEYGDKVIAYSGDTEWTGALIDVADGADLFVCECNFFEPKGPGHMDYRTLVEKRPQLRSDRIVLTHMSDEVLSRLDEIEFETASDGAVIEL